MQSIHMAMRLVHTGRGWKRVVLAAMAASAAVLGVLLALDGSSAVAPTRSSQTAIASDGVDAFDQNPRHQLALNDLPYSVPSSQTEVDTFNQNPRWNPDLAAPGTTRAGATAGVDAENQNPRQNSALTARTS